MGLFMLFSPLLTEIKNILHESAISKISFCSVKILGGSSILITGMAIRKHDELKSFDLVQRSNHKHNLDGCYRLWGFLCEVFFHHSRIVSDGCQSGSAVSPCLFISDVSRMNCPLFQASLQFIIRVITSFGWCLTFLLLTIERKNFVEFSVSTEGDRFKKTRWEEDKM